MFAHVRANPLATAALAVALTGATIAIGGLPHNSVGSAQLRKGAVHNSDLGKHSISAAKLSPDALRVSGTRGPRGPAGQPGLNGLSGSMGPTGKTGPTEGFASTEIDTVPSGTPDVTLASQEITTTTTGRIYGFGRGSYTMVCSLPTSNVKAGLYLDGIPLAGSGAALPDSVATDLNLFGLTAGSVVPGVHMLELKVDCVGGDNMGGGVAGQAFGAIVLGG